MTACGQLAYLLELRTAALNNALSSSRILARDSLTKDLRIRALEQEAEELRADERAKNNLFTQVRPALARRTTGPSVCCCRSRQKYVTCGSKRDAPRIITRMCTSLNIVCGVSGSTVCAPQDTAGRVQCAALSSRGPTSGCRTAWPAGADDSGKSGLTRAN